MLPHQAFRDRHSQPTVVAARHLEEHVPIITAIATDKVMKWDNGPDYDKQAYKTISRSGFQNDDYKWLVQLACLFAEFLMRTKRLQLDDAIDEGCSKAADFLLAQILHRNLKSFKILPANVAEMTTNLLRALPQLSIDFNLSLSGGINNQGIDMTDMNQLVNVNTPNGVMTMPYGQAIQLGLAAPPQMQPQFQTAPVPGQHYNQQMGYQQQLTPAQVQEYKWQQLQAMRQNQGQQMPAANMMGQQAGGTMMPINYNQNTQTNMGSTTNGGVGQPIMPQEQQSNVQMPPGQNQGGTPIVTKTTSSVDAWYQTNPNVDSASVESTVEQARPNVIPAATAGWVESLIPTATGYLYPYNFPTRVDMNSGLDMDQATMYPVMFDSTVSKGMWVINKHKDVVNFTVQELKAMEYDKHDVAQYFSAQRNADAKIDKKRTMKLLADVQKKAYIAERLDTIEPMYDEEGTVVPANDKVYRFGDPIEIPKLLIGENTTYDYSLRLLRVEGLGDEMHEAMEDAVVNYEHQYLQPVVIGEPFATIALKLKKARFYKDILDVLEELHEHEGLVYAWQYINRTATEYINKLLAYRFRLSVEIQSFYLDYDELVDHLDENYGISALFTSSAQELISSALYPYSADDEVFDETWKDGVCVAFGILSDVTILPILSDEINLPVPVPEDANASELKMRSSALVSNRSYPELFRAIKHRVSNADPRASRIAFGTKDGEFFFVQKTSNETSFIITRTP